MKRSLHVLVGLLIAANLVFAHDPHSARFELHANLNEGALLHIYLTQAGVHNTLLDQNPDVDFSVIEMDQYKKMIVTYLKDHIRITGDNLKMEIGIGAIKLGSHQTELKFHIKNYPEKVEKLEVDIDAFSESGNQHSIFCWYTPVESSKIVLSSKNDFKGTFRIRDLNDSMTASTIMDREAIIWSFLAFGVLFVAFLLRNFFLRATL